MSAHEERSTERKDLTRVPWTPAFMRGVIHLRGKGIPVVDLHLKFEMEWREVTDKTGIIVVPICRGSGAVAMGIIVDEVSEVLDVAGGQHRASAGIWHFGGHIIHFGNGQGGGAGGG